MWRKCSSGPLILGFALFGFSVLIRAMLEFFQPRTKPATPESPEPDAREELLTELRRLDGELARIATATAAFRKKHFALIDCHVVMVSENIEGRAALESTWRDFANRAYKANQARAKVLDSLAELKFGGNPHYAKR